MIYKVMNICWKLYFRTLKCCYKIIVFLPRHLNLENILTYCVPCNLFLKCSLLGLKMTPSYIYLHTNFRNPDLDYFGNFVTLS